MRTSWKRWLGVFTVGGVVLGLVPTAGAAVHHATPVTITLYSGQHEQTVAKLVTGFEKATGIKVNVRSDDEDALADQIITEGSKSPGDVFLTENSLPLEALQAKGLLAKVSSSTLAKVSSKWNSPKGDWVGVSGRISVFDYNKSKLGSLKPPTSVLDLAKPVWKGKIGIAPGETDFQPIIESVYLKYGKAKTISWLEGLKANAGSHNYPDNESLVAAINNGQVAAGVINHYYWYRLRDEVGKAKVHSQLSYFAPHDPGYVFDVSGAGILASSKKQAADQKFLAYLVSKAGEEIIAHSESYEYPLGSGVVTAKPLKAFSSLKPTALSIKQLGDGATPISFLQEVGLL